MKNWKAGHLWTVFAIWLVVFAVATAISGAVESGQQSGWPRPIDIVQNLEPLDTGVEAIAAGDVLPRRWVRFRGRREGDPLFLFHVNKTSDKPRRYWHVTYAVHRIYPPDVPAGTPGKPFILWKECIQARVDGHVDDEIEIPLNPRPLPEQLMDFKGMLHEDDDLLGEASRIAGGAPVREIFLPGERPMFVTAILFHAGWLGLVGCLVLLAWFRAGRALKLLLVEVDHAEPPVGAPLTVAVTLQAKADLALNRILLRLTCEEEIVIGSGKQQTTKREVVFKDEQVLGENMTIRPGEERRWGARFSVPLRGLPTLEVAAHRVRWKLEADLDILGLLDVSRTVRLKVLPFRFAADAGEPA